MYGISVEIQESKNCSDCLISFNVWNQRMWTVRTRMDKVAEHPSARQSRKTRRSRHGSWTVGRHFLTYPGPWVTQVTSGYPGLPSKIQTGQSHVSDSMRHCALEVLDETVDSVLAIQTST